MISSCVRLGGKPRIEKRGCSMGGADKTGIGIDTKSGVGRGMIGGGERLSSGGMKRERSVEITPE